MPPKKNTTKAKAESKAKPNVEDRPTTGAEAPSEGDLKATEEVKPSEAPATFDPDVETKEDVKKDAAETSTDTKQSKKRKKAPDSEEPSKSSRKSARGAAKPSQQQLINFLLTKEAEDLVRPDDEKKDIKERGDIRTYSGSVLNPFEELLSAVILSRPISHRLGLRSIRTVLNDPYNFTSAKAVQNAGEEKRHQALWDARTQHKGKTAEQIGMIADVILEKFTTSDDKEGTQMKKLLSESNDDIDQALEKLKENIKGLGNTGLDIFLRRIQWLWHQGFPYADGRTKDALRKIGLSQDPEELNKTIEQHWSKLATKHLAGENEAAKKRRAFVVVLERATGADLENKIDEVYEAAVAAS